MIRFILISLLLIASFTGFGIQVPEGDVPDWLEYRGKDPVPGVTLRWRVYPKYARPKEHFFEFDFINTTDTTRLFDYLLTTNAWENKVGRMSLEPGANRLSGWYFNGTTITRFGTPPPGMIDAIVSSDHPK